MIKTIFNLTLLSLLAWGCGTTSRVHLDKKPGFSAINKIALNAPSQAIVTHLGQPFMVIDKGKTIQWIYNDDVWTRLSFLIEKKSSLVVQKMILIIATDSVSKIDVARSTLKGNYVIEHAPICSAHAIPNFQYFVDKKMGHEIKASISEGKVMAIRWTQPKPRAPAAPTTRKCPNDVKKD